MACAPQTFSGITQDYFANIVALAAEKGIAIPSHAGQSSRSGFTVRWHFDPAAETLTVHCVSQPFFVPCATVQEGVTRLVRHCAPTTA